jgi:hypothetical protein
VFPDGPKSECDEEERDEKRLTSVVIIECLNVIIFARRDHPGGVQSHGTNLKRSISSARANATSVRVSTLHSLEGGTSISSPNRHNGQARALTQLGRLGRWCSLCSWLKEDLHDDDMLG